MCKWATSRAVYCCLLFPLDQAPALFLTHVCSFHCHLRRWTHPVERANWIHNQTMVRPHLQAAGGKLPRNNRVFQCTEPWVSREGGVW